MRQGDATVGGLSSAARTLHWDVAKRDPHDVLGVEPRRVRDQIKAAWRRLARANHPDLTGDDPARVAGRHAPDGRDQRRLCRADPRDARRAVDGSDRAGDPADVRRGRRASARRPAAAPSRHARSPGGSTRAPPTGRATRPPRTARRGPRSPASRRLRGERVDGEPPRASTPTGPLIKDRVRHFRRPTAAAAGRRPTLPGRVREVPWPHARPDRGLRAVLHRLAQRDRDARPGARRGRARRPGRSRPPGDPPPRPPGAGAAAAAPRDRAS